MIAGLDALDLWYNTVGCQFSTKTKRAQSRLAATQVIWRAFFVSIEEGGNETENLHIAVFLTVGAIKKGMGNVEYD